MSFKLTAIALATVLTANLVAAQTTAAPKAPEPDYTVSYNLGATTDYRYRGISQSRLKPAVQGGLDFAHKNGFYLGAWASSIKWVQDGSAPTLGAVNTGDNRFEVDLYGGIKKEIAKDVTLDVGFLSYMYPGNKYSALGGADADTLELYAAATYGAFTAKYSRSTTSLFGTADTARGLSSKGSGYLDLSATFDLGDGYSIVPHVGNQVVKNFSSASYSDYSLTLNKELKDYSGVVVSATAVATTAKTNLGAPASFGMAYASPEGKNLGRGGFFFAIKKNF